MQQNHQFTMLVRLHARSVTSFSSRRILPNRCHQTSRLPQFPSSCRRYASIAQEVPQSASARDVARPTAMWLVPKDSKFDQKQVLEILPRLDGSRRDLSVVLFLVTPKLAYLFEENHSFLSRAVNSIYSASLTGALRQSIVAVVDALPILDPGSPQEPEIDGSEGVAMCIASGFDVTSAKDGDSSQPLITMNAKHPYFDGRHYVSVSCSAPVANTTFINGQQNTLFMQNWRNPDGQQWVSETKRHKLSQVSIPSYKLSTGNVSLPINMYSKIIKLTDPKVITHSMGNIVRQVRTIDGEELAASHELEKIVPGLLKKLQKSIATGDIRVFALIYPHELGGKDSFRDHIWGGKGDRPQGGNTRHGHDNLKLLTLLARGARLYRVTSGGAGWGKKAGLLSLEPTTELGVPSDAPELPSFIFESDEDIRMPGSADLFPPGHIVQFLATFHDTEGSKKEAISIEHAKKLATGSRRATFNWMDPIVSQHLCIGNTILPETHQYTSIEDVDKSSTGADLTSPGARSNLVFRPNQFGCLTSSALGLSVKYHSPGQKMQAQMKKGNTSLDFSGPDTSYKHNSLVELPNSYFMSKFAAGEQASIKAVRQYTGSEEMIAIGNSIATETMTSSRELTQQESVFAVSQRLRHIERLQKDNYLAKKKPVSRRGSEASSQLEYNEVSIVTKHESTSKKSEVRSSLVKREKGSALVRRISAVRSFKVRLVPYSKGLPESTENTSEDTEVDTWWTPLTSAGQRMNNTPGESLRLLYRQMDSRLLDSGLATESSEYVQSEDEDSHRQSESGPFRKVESGDLLEIRRVRKMKRARINLRNLGLRSGIFRVYDSDSVHCDDMEDVNDRREIQAVQSLTRDL